jgi:hypothetical protein
MREDRNFKASDVSGPSIWILILCRGGNQLATFGLLVFGVAKTGKLKIEGSIPTAVKQFFSLPAVDILRATVAKKLNI